MGAGTSPLGRPVFARRESLTLPLAFPDIGNRLLDGAEDPIVAIRFAAEQIGRPCVRREAIRLPLRREAIDGATRDQPERGQLASVNRAWFHDSRLLSRDHSARARPLWTLAAGAAKSFRNRATICA